MDTPITVSSSLSSINKLSKKCGPRQKSVAHCSESSIARIPVSWDSPATAKSYDRGLNCTPTTLQKVNSWINSLNRLNRSNVDSAKSSLNKLDTEFHGFDNGSDMDSDFLHGMMVSKLESKEDTDTVIEDELKQYRSVTYCSYEKDRTSDEMLHSGPPRKHSHPKSFRRRRPVQTTNLVEKEVNISEESDSDVPLSPESEKKKELCSYLQLMKPTDKKTVMILQNRRSVRVKNLSIMHEKRELEKKLREENSEDTNDYDLSKFPSLPSPEEMNVDIEERRRQWLKYNGPKAVATESFHFPHPKDSLGNIVSDFDRTINEDWFRGWNRESGKVPRESAANNSQGLKTKPEPNVHSKTSKPVNIDSTNAKPMVGADSIGEGILEDAAATKTRVGVKRACVISYENAINEKRVKLDKKEDIITENRVEDQKGTAENLDNQKKQQSKILNSITNKQEKPMAKEKVKVTIQNKLNEIMQVEKLEPEHFSIPKPSLLLATDVHDFGDVFKCNKKDLIKKKSASKESASSETKLSKPEKSKDSLLKKRKQVKKLRPFLRKTSSFKIKLITKSKNSGSPSKTSKGLVKTNPGFASDNLKSSLDSHCKPVASPKKKNLKLKKFFKLKDGTQVTKKENLKEKSQSTPKSLRVKNNSGLVSDDLKVSLGREPTKPTESSPKKKKVVKNKKEIQLTKKENVKGIDKSPKQSTIVTEVLPNSPFKDNNENPMIFEFTKPPGLNVEQKIFDALPQERVFDVQSPRAGDLPHSIPDIDLKSPRKSRKTRLLSKKKSEERAMSPQSMIMAIFKDKTNGLSNLGTDFLKTQTSTADNNKGAFYSEILDVEKSSDDDMPTMTNIEYSTIPDAFSKSSTPPLSSREELPSIGNVNCDRTPFIYFKKDKGIQPLHRCLNSPKQKKTPMSIGGESSPTNWTLASPSHKQKKNQHSIHVSREYGPVLKIFYMEYNLVLCQESLVSFWTQTALGNVLGAQNMWINKGSVQRLSMNNNCVFKESLEMVVSSDNNLAYIELWTKEHQSDIREGPVADVFATVYFWMKGYNGLDKKVLQLENINGFADDVQYSVIKSAPKIVVSWHLANNELESKKTFIHCYQLAADFQSVCNISEFEAVEHYVSSLHNIEGCDTLIMGCGENKITLWNIEHGYVAATIEMLDIKSPLATLWVKCDRGFLFTLQQCVDRELRLIAIHGMNHAWKKLASYKPSKDYDRLKGVCLENGIVLAFYNQGIICWNAQTMEVVVEAGQHDAEFISGKYIISIVNDQVKLRHAITHLVSADES